MSKNKKFFWLKLKEDFFENNLKGTSLYRGGYEQISRNINTLKK